MRKSWVLVLIAALGLTVTGGLLLSAGAAPSGKGARNAWARARVAQGGPVLAHHEGGQDIRLRARESHFEFINVDGRRSGPGDYFVGREVVFRNGRRAGYTNVKCTNSFPFNRRAFTAQCEATVTLHRGQISVAGTVAFTRTTGTETLPITGGSGHFQNVRGQLRFAGDGYILELIP
jgi:Allene oxide cyclase barrel like domain